MTSAADTARPRLLSDLISEPRWPERDALVFPEARFTYAELLELSQAKARLFAALGVGKGDHVGILMPNSPELVFVFFGIQLLGAVAVPINTRFRPAELAYVIEHADLKLLVTTDIIDDHVRFVDRVNEALPSLSQADAALPLALAEAPSLRHVVLLGSSSAAGMIAGEQLDRIGQGAAATGPSSADAEDPAVILFTSGTTANPKACLLTHAGILYVWQAVGIRFDIRSGDRVFDPLPMFHMSCIGPMVSVLSVGATLQSMMHFEPDAALDMIEAEASTWLYTMFPTVTIDLIRHPTFAERDLSQIRLLSNVGPAETLAMLQDAFPQAIHIPGPFGMTEASGAITCEEPTAPVEEGKTTTGRPLPGTEVRVVDQQGRTLPAGTSGELLVRGPGLMKGYYRDAEATAALIDADGWLHSGDIGFKQPDGRVVYEGRSKDMLKVGGENVAATEIESQISCLPAVMRVAVIGKPDDRLGEVPVAFVEVTPGQSLAAEEVIAYCRERLAGFKVPREVRFVTEWPSSATKIQKYKLRALLDQDGPK